MRITKLLKARFLILLSLAMVMSLAAVAVVQASAPTPSSGGYTFIADPETFKSKVVGQNLFYTVKGMITFTGTLSGTGYLVETGVVHGDGEGPLVAHAVIDFSGSIGDLSSDCGTIIIEYNRIKQGGFASPVQTAGVRQFLSHTGTGCLANLHGTAQFDGAFGVGTYEGQYHFD